MQGLVSLGNSCFRRMCEKPLLNKMKIQCEWQIYDGTVVIVFLIF